MAHAKRIIKKESGSKGRVRNASETGKRGQPLQRSSKVMPHGGSSSLVINGALSLADRKEIFSLIEAEGLAASRRDPSKRIEHMVVKSGSTTIFVSDPHLALALGKKVHRARKGGELTITWSHDDMPVRVSWAKK